MKRKWHKGQYGVESLGSEDEFAPRQYRVKVFDLRPLGVQDVPAFSQCSYRKRDDPSPWHVHRNCVEFIYCVAGKCQYESEGKKYPMSAGMVFLSRANEAHRQVDCPKGYATYCIHFRPTASATSKWFLRQFEDLPRCFHCRRSLSARFGKILALAESSRTDMALRVRLQAEFRLLLLELIETAAEPAVGRKAGLFNEIARKIESQPERNYRLEDLIAKSGLCKASFISQFKAELGYSPHAYVLFCRTEAAKRLLRNGLSVKEIAERLGFPTAQHLTRTFKNFVGIPPAKWLGSNGA